MGLERDKSTREGHPTKSLNLLPNKISQSRWAPNTGDNEFILIFMISTTTQPIRISSLCKRNERELTDRKDPWSFKNYGIHRFEVDALTYVQLLLAINLRSGVDRVPVQTEVPRLLSSDLNILA